MTPPPPTCSDALLVAAEYGDSEQLLAALDSGESPACVDSDDRTPLHLAAQANEHEVALHLLRLGATMSQDAFGRAPLHSAASKGHVSMSELLLDAKAYIELVDVAGRAPLHYSARGGHQAMVSMLLSRGAAIDRADGDNRTALHHASRADEFLSVTLELLDRGADLVRQDIIGFTPLHHACFEAQNSTIFELLERGADIYALDYSGWNPLVHAASQNHEVLVRDLVTYLLKPKTYPMPDPSKFIKQDINDPVFLGLPGFVLALFGVLFSFFCCVVPAMWWLRRFARLRKPYISYLTDEERESFLKEIFQQVEASDHLKKLCDEWDRVPVNGLADLHRVKNKG